MSADTQAVLQKIQIDPKRVIMMLVIMLRIAGVCSPSWWRPCCSPTPRGSVGGRRERLPVLQ